MKRNQRTFLILLLSIFFFVGKAYSQENIVATGGKGTGTGGTSSYSIGQIADLRLQGSGGSGQEGIQQPYEIATLGIDEFKEINLTVTAYPNPTVDVLNLNITNDKLDNLAYDLFDINGKIVSKTSKIIASETTLNMHGLSQGVYFLRINSNSKTIKTFKIIKK
ncbi:T9SS type A sorting domain-containing protein [Flavobacterium chungbukense]|uniref:T9SS type A sorting domain-containing protein n=1 Tax=Flavobacterium chungbukense TaxID=877464 RepID=UPI001E5DA62A|nr:T9SS type A sorting domain-containing protein [Flavobacterium chungbukense]MCC4920972.1 T9SS type A sorting domain-containing protein [Flavobacterium chungbukense]